MRQDSTECGRAAFDSILRHGVTPTPDNFAIWFEYHSGLNPELRHLIDMGVGAAGSCDDAMMVALHRKFFARAGEGDALREASQRMQGLLQEVGAAVGDAGAGARNFGAVVRDTSSAFVAGVTSLPLLIQRLREEAQAMVERSELVGQHLAGAAERIQLLERSLDDLRHDATTDGLTGLHNRRGFDARLSEAAAAAAVSGTALALVLIDIDHFKRVNDEWGHQTGDQVLRLVAAMLTASTRPGDFVARYGGEEFAVIMPATDAAAAFAVADRVRRGFEGRRIVARASGKTIGGVTVSAGGACFVPGEKPDDWVERVDQALYAAKQGGRNRVCMASAVENFAPAASDRTPAAVA